MTLAGLWLLPEATLAQQVKIAQRIEQGTFEDSPSDLSPLPDTPPSAVDLPVLNFPENFERPPQSETGWEIKVEQFLIEPLIEDSAAAAGSLSFSLDDLYAISTSLRFKADAQAGLREIDCPGLTSNNQESIGAVRDKYFSLSQLLEVAAAVRAFYHCEGYQTSTARINILPDTEEQRVGPVTIQVIEGYLPEGNIQISRQRDSQHQRLSPEYVRAQLNLSDTTGPLDINELQETLQLLQLDPLIQNVSASLADGEQRGESRLLVNFTAANPFSGQVTLNNSRSPSIGTFERQAQVSYNNLLGFGDRIRAEYSNTEGSDALDLSYQVPINSRKGTLAFRFNTASNDIVEPPFDDVDADGSGPDIESNSQTYEMTLRQPLSRRILTRQDEDNDTRRTFEEFAIGLTGSLRNSWSTLLDLPFPAAGADENGRTRIATLRFFQEWTRQNSDEIFALRSQFNVGLDAFDSTVNESILGLGSVPDSRFFSWQGQAQWLKRLDDDMFLLVRGTTQLADQALLSAEQFALGGYGSVRGYRQDFLQTDNGIFTSAEVQVPVMRMPRLDGVLQVVPFVDVGTVWSNSGIALDPNTLASIGLGLQWRQGERLTARLDYGIPLVSVESRNRTWQENGVYFTLQYNPF
ncbi:MAG: ShlB/FhaC/HecB family hemolysin secretion/activation protein [Cyanobacteria bacterium P01_B01_bin.77]